MHLELGLVQGRAVLHFVLCLVQKLPTFLLPFVLGRALEAGVWLEWKALVSGKINLNRSRDGIGYGRSVELILLLL